MTPMAVGLAMARPPFSAGMTMYIMRMACIPQKLTKSHRATLQIGRRALGCPANAPVLAPATVTDSLRA